MNKNEELFTLHIDKRKFTGKPKPDDMKTLKNRLQSESLLFSCSLEQIKNCIEQGRTVSFGVLKGGAKASNWVQQQIFAVDIDNNVENESILTKENILQICKQNAIEPACIYNTFSSTPEHPKYRVVFVCDSIISDESTRNLIMNVLISLFPQADVSCKNADRVFYGTNKTFTYFDRGARFSINDIHAINAVKIANEVSKEYRNDSNLETLKNEFDFEGLVRRECGKITVENNRYIQFENCPICGHHKCFTYYKTTKSFYCFGAHGQIGGDIINYISHTKNLSIKEAIDHFKYDIMEVSRPQQYKKTQNTTDNENVKGILEKLYEYHTPPHKLSYTDKDYSELFAFVAKENFFYNVTSDNWMFYNGKNWEIDKKSCKIQKYCKDFYEALYKYSLKTELFSDIEDKKTRNKQEDLFSKYVNSLSKKNVRDTLIKDAQSEIPISNEDFDNKPNLLNLQNGTFNTETFEFREHRSEDFLSKIANAEYNPQGKSEEWERTINEIFEGNTDKIFFVKKALGYSLTAKTNFETAFIFFGEKTRNGKSTIVETISYILGDYASHAQPETFTTKQFVNSRNASSDIARLKGIRFLSVAEFPQKANLDVSTFKTLTGRDKITARHLYQQEFEFIPQFKLFLHTNFLPQVNDKTLFASKRVNVITFDRHFNEEEQDKELKDRLIKTENLSGILNWCIEGLRLLNQEGLNPPNCIKDATNKYYADSDRIENFLNECLNESSNNNIKASDLYTVYLNWCKSYSYSSEGKQSFIKNLRARNLITEHGSVNGVTCHNILRGYAISDCFFS